MNTADLIRFIQSSRGLSLGNKFLFKTMFCLPVMLLIIFFSGNWMGNALKVVSLFVITLILLLNACYFFFSGRKNSVKYKLLIRPVVSMNVVFPLFYACCIKFYDIFGLKRLLLYYVFPIAVLTLFFVLIAKTKTYSNSKTSSIFPVCFASGITFGIGHRLNSLMSEKLSNTMHFVVIAILMLLSSCFLFSIAVLDLQRYYYFTKLEKQGLVTEDILKAEE